MKIKTKDLALTGILTAIAIIIPLTMPIKIISPPFTATLASHVPLILAMFISPLSAVFVALGSAVGFLFSLGPIVAARAATHVFFVLVGALMLRKKMNIFFIIAVTMIIHALSDMAIVYIFASYGMDILKNQSMLFVQEIIGFGTSIHHVMDFVLAMIIISATAKASKDTFQPLVFRIKKRDDA